MLTTRQTEIATKYLDTYPHLRALVRRSQSGDGRASKALGDNMSKVAYPSWVSGPDALEIAKIGMDAEEV